jgi:flagellar biosynthesis/type III secretory pathway M-ring protein FliF/YscJ
VCVCVGGGGWCRGVFVVVVVVWSFLSATSLPLSSPMQEKKERKAKDGEPDEGSAKPKKEKVRPPPPFQPLPLSPTS